MNLLLWILARCGFMIIIALILKEQGLNDESACLDAALLLAATAWKPSWERKGDNDAHNR